ncbi:MAG: cytochrome c oxidase subunit II [Phycisphaerales bacterium]|nr:cytochrome c oxidase subunit II [Phycisphaerales bacterium]
MCDPQTPPISGSGVTSILEPNSAPAREIRSLGYLVVSICAVIFVVVQTFLVIAIVRGVRAARAARITPSATAEPVQVYGSLPIEVAWTVIPVIVVFVLTMVTIRTIRDIDLTKPPEGSLAVTAIGHQWWWEFRYTAPDGSSIITANEMHIPSGRPIWVRLESADVIHSFWVPRLAGKLDVIPATTNELWLEADVPGVYLGQCAEYCGTQHAHMLIRVYAQEQAQFDAWLAAQALPAIEDISVAVGRQTFTNLACMNCHTIDGTSEGMFGPNLSHIASRDTIGSGYILQNRENLRAWIKDPNSLKPGCNMPSLQLSDTQVDGIVEYLMTLK